LRSFELDDLANCAWTIWSTVHSVLNDTQGQIVFGRDMLFGLPFTTKYEEIRKQKQEASDAITHKENSKEVHHEYKVNDQVLLDRGVLQRSLKHLPSFQSWHMKKVHCLLLATYVKIGAIPCISSALEAHPFIMLALKDPY
jgi:hypothetical protein